MRIATWNVNSIRTRKGRVIDFLENSDIDVLAMQEIKCKPEQFPYEEFEAAGYEVIAHGLNQWNGVAFASRLPIEDAVEGFDGMPGFSKKPVEGDLPLEARALGVTIEGMRLWSLYVPNGRELDDPHYTYKLEWLKALRAATQARRDAHPDEPLALMGDFNIAPLDIDVWDPEFFVGKTHTSQLERDAFNAFLDDGMIDVTRELGVEGYTYWDYTQLRFPRNEGMRIDFVLGNPEFLELVTEAEIARDERKGDGPSDHVPVIVELDTETSLDDDMPMIF
ncbi:exodeoxyribonuclease III [Gulosibacter molinativorax]|uniref:Exodeoxyribonuclease III n=1 Tax=Gulosibacter molinativorax TaxID=256821 RepID=A0ABT7C8Z6_9MICO|nr:exodeoxyribonuclease III [Gulosibacter molinativorax]MDJ1371202.1 exodeoxyribonuclease III [Gulosibacter molinativorax]QUY63017.1 Putative exonuclease III [Gulosibacter molinativorax]